MTSVPEIKTFAVVGLGKMGADWVTQILEAGHAVIGFDASDGCRASAADRVGQGLAWVARKRHPEEDGFAGAALARLEVVDDEESFVAAAAERAQVLLEVVFEDLKLKCELFGRIVPRLSDSTIVWSNTSSLSVSKMGVAGGRPERFVGTHGMNPVYQMPAVEVVTHDRLDSSVLEATEAALRGMGKVTFRAADVPGFWVNKHLVPFSIDAIRALERGEITVSDGDVGLKNSLGHPQGVFKLMDYVGLDTMYRVTMAMYLDSQDPRYYPPSLLARLFAAGEVGVKSGAGFYRWEGGKPVEARDFSADRITDSGMQLFGCAR